LMYSPVRYESEHCTSTLARAKEYALKVNLAILAYYNETVVADPPAAETSAPTAAAEPSLRPVVKTKKKDVRKDENALHAAALIEIQRAQENVGALCAAYESLNNRSPRTSETGYMRIFCKHIRNIAAYAGKTSPYGMAVYQQNDRIGRRANKFVMKLAHGGATFSAETVKVCGDARAGCIQACETGPNGFGCACNLNFAGCLAESLSD
jgi:hypothetical protein